MRCVVRGRWLKALIGIALFLVLLVCPLGEKRVQADGTASTDEIVRVAVLDYPNFMQYQEDGSIYGYAYEYLKTIQNYTNWKYEFIVMNLKDAMAALEKGDIDLVAGMQYSETRKTLFDFSDSYMGTGGTVLCTRIGNQAYAYNDFANYDGMKIAVLTGTIRDRDLKDHLAEFDTQVTLINYDTDLEAKNALMNYEVDAILMSSIRCDKNLKIIARLQNVPIYFVSNSKRPDIKEKIDEAQMEIHMEFPYYEQTLSEKYFGDLDEEIALSEVEKRYLKNCGTIHVAVSSEMKPYSYYDRETGTYQGIIIDAFQVISDYSGLKFQYQEMTSPKNVIQQMQNGEVQIIAIIKQDDRIAEKMKLKLTNSYCRNSVSVIQNKNISNYRDPSLKIAIRDNSPQVDEIVKEIGYQNIMYYDSIDSCVDAVNAGKAQVTFLPSLSADRVTRHAYYSNLTTTVLPDSVSNYCIGVSDSVDPILTAILNKGLSAVDNETWTDLVVKNVLINKDDKTFRDKLAENMNIIMISITLLLVITIILLMIFASKRKKINASLQEAAIQSENAMNRAKVANEAKSDFLSRMSHDIRTPMNAVLGLARLGEEETTDGKSRVYFNKINNSSEYLLGLLNDILDMSRIETGKVELHEEIVDIKAYSEGIVDIINPLLQEREITLIVNTSHMSMKYIYLDKLRMKQIIVNLLNNAIKFSPHGSRIEWTILDRNRESDQITYEQVIKDYGCGMSEEFCEKIFHPFEQEENPYSNEKPGAGLGLAICKNLVEQMGGFIQVKSKLGEGSEFVVTMTHRISQTPPETEKKYTNSLDSLKGRKVLLCEDHPLNTEIAKRLLEKKGIEVVCAEDGKIGLKLFDDSELYFYDAILMDMRMPVMDGIEATKAIRKLNREDAKSIPIIAMTANAYEEDKKNCRSAGMNAHLSKPVDANLMFNTICMCMEENKTKKTI